MAQIKRIPYGMSDFKQLRREGLYFVDKTMFLPVMEDADHFLFLVRPRRFGKSIFLSMMRAYYDVNERDNFDKLFEELWIAEHPRALAVEQIRKYGQADRTQMLASGTQLHLIIVQIRGWRLERMEEIAI